MAENNRNRGSYRTSNQDWNENRGRGNSRNWDDDRNYGQSENRGNVLSRWATNNLLADQMDDYGQL